MSETIRDVVIRISTEYRGSVGEIKIPDFSKPLGQLREMSDLYSKLGNISSLATTDPKTAASLGLKMTVPDLRASVTGRPSAGSIGDGAAEKAALKANAELKKQTEAEYAGYAKLYEQDELKKIKAAEEAAAFQKIKIEETTTAANEAAEAQAAANEKLRGSIGRVGEGTMLLARGYIFATAASKTEIDKQVQYLIRFQSVLDNVSGTVKTMSGLVDMYTAMRAGSAAAAAGNEILAVSNTKVAATNEMVAKSAVAAKGGAAGMVAGIHPLVAIAGVAALAVYGIKEALGTEKAKYIEVIGVMHEAQVAQQEYNKAKGEAIRQAGIRDTFRESATGRGPVPMMDPSAGVDGADWGFFRPNARSEKENKKKFSEEENLRKEIENDEKNARIRAEIAGRWKGGEIGIQADQAMHGVRQQIAGGRDEATLIEVRIAATNRLQAAEKSYADDKRAFSAEAVRGTLSAMQLQDSYATNKLSAAQKEWAVQRDLSAIEGERLKIKALPVDPEKSTESQAAVAEKLVELEKRRASIIVEQGANLRANMQTQADSIAQMKTLIQSEENRVRGVNQQIGKLSEGDWQEAQFLLKMQKDKQPMQKEQRERLETLLPATGDWNRKEEERIGKDRGGANGLEGAIGKQEGAGSVIEAMRKQLQEMTKGGEEIKNARKQIMENEARQNEALRDLVAVFKDHGNFGEKLEYAIKEIKELKRGKAKRSE